MKYIIITEESLYSGIFEVMFNDIIKNDNTEIISKYLYEESKFRKYLFKFLYKNKVNKILKGAFEPILKPRYSLEKVLKENENEECVVIFMNSSLQKFYTEKSLKKIKIKYNVKYVLLFVDAIFQKQAQRAYHLMKSDIFDLVYTFDKADSEKYKLIYFNTPYSKLNSISSENKYNGVYFCGSDKGRIDILEAIAVKLNELNILYKFDVYSKIKTNKSYHFNFKSEDYKAYEDILKDTLEYSCILDIVQAGRDEDTGLSLRIYEATLYNKILITNNINIFNYDLYDPRYMHYISDVNDIKIEWLLEKPNYNYNGQLSPKLFIKDIESRLKGKLNER